jgi:hypothetical protein
MAASSNDSTALTRIEQLASEEHRLFEKGTLDDVERRRLSQIQVELDQCWDLLRQRRALREFGGDASDARPRPPDVVEKYEG